MCASVYMVADFVVSALGRVCTLGVLPVFAVGYEEPEDIAVSSSCILLLHVDVVGKCFLWRKPSAV